MPNETTIRRQPLAAQPCPPADGDAHEQAPEKVITPDEFYRRVVSRPEIRDLLRRLAKR